MRQKWKREQQIFDATMGSSTWTDAELDIDMLRAANDDHALKSEHTDAELQRGRLSVAYAQIEQVRSHDYEEQIRKRLSKVRSDTMYQPIVKSLNYVKQSILGRLVLSTLAMPAVAIFPPLEYVGRRSRDDQHLLKALNAPPRVRFYLFEASNIALASCVSFASLPIHREDPDFWRDAFFLLWSASSMAKEVEFVTARGVSEFVRDVHSIIGLLASLFNLSALLLNLCNPVDCTRLDSNLLTRQHSLHSLVTCTYSAIFLWQGLSMWKWKMDFITQQIVKIACGLALRSGATRSSPRSRLKKY